MTDYNTVFTELSLQKEYHKQKKLEAWEILTSLYDDWEGQFQGSLAFKIKNTLVATFNFGEAELDLIRAHFMAIHAYHNREYDKAIRSYTELTNRISG